MSPGGYDIAPAAPADIEDVHALIVALAEYERLTELCVSTPVDIQRALFGSPASAEALIVRDRGDPRQALGFALFFHTFSTFRGRRSLWLEDLFVRPDARGHGIGRSLLLALAALAKARDCARFEWAVLDWNRPAIGFYQKLGAQVLPDWRIARVTGPALDALAAGRVPSSTP